MTDIAYTPHATHWMRLRRITRREVETALADPEILCPGHCGRKVIRTHVRGRLLRIVYETGRVQRLVVSVLAPLESHGAA